MIIAECVFGKIKLVRARSICGALLVKRMYDLARPESLNTWEGSTGLAVFDRMKEFLPSSKILEENYPDRRADVT